MPLTDREIALVRQSFARLREIKTTQNPFGEAFYERLFEKMPEARSLFRSDLSEQGMRFLSTLGVIVDCLDAPEGCTDTMQRLGQGHAAYGVKAEHYGPMGEALRETMADWLGERYDAETDAAWAAAYSDVAERIRTSAPGA